MPADTAALASSLTSALVSGMCGSLSATASGSFSWRVLLMAPAASEGEELVLDMAAVGWAGKCWRRTFERRVVEILTRARFDVRSSEAVRLEFRSL